MGTHVTAPVCASVSPDMKAGQRTLPCLHREPCRWLNDITGVKMFVGYILMKVKKNSIHSL